MLLITSFHLEKATQLELLCLKIQTVFKVRRSNHMFTALCTEKANGILIISWFITSQTTAAPNQSIALQGESGHAWHALYIEQKESILPSITGETSYQNSNLIPLKYLLAEDPFFLFPKCPSLTFVFLDSIGHLICRTCQVQFIPWIFLYLKTWQMNIPKNPWHYSCMEKILLTLSYQGKSWTVLLFFFLNTV